MIIGVLTTWLLLAIAVTPSSCQGAKTQWLILYEDMDFGGRTLTIDSFSGVDRYCEDISACSGDPTLDNAFSSARLTGA